MNFKNYLDTLRLSAKEAIVDGEKDSLDELKNYLHIQRPLEPDLARVIQEAVDTPSCALVLLLGNVGDGKSHLLARMWHVLPDIMQCFSVHNDATESVYKNKSYLENLSEIFSPYNDSNINHPENTKKTVIAINLGTLTNFLEEFGHGFSQLKAYVADNHLVDQNLSATKLKAHTHFYALNLTDYHIFHLEADGAKSQVLYDIIDKITHPSLQNVFYRAYLESYEAHPDPKSCPIRYNYQLISKPEIQHAVNQILVKSIISDKQIVSVRLVMNLVYDMIVPAELSSLSEEEIREKVLSTSFRKEFYYYTLPVILFESKTTSTILKSFSKLDPVSTNNEPLDELIVKLSTANNPTSYFVNYILLQADDPLLNALQDLNVKQRVQLFLRLGFLNDLLSLRKDPVYDDYLRYLFAFNTGRTEELHILYELVKYAIYQWNGTVTVEGNWINLDVAPQQGVYTISLELSLDFSPPETLFRDIENLTCFSDTLKLGFLPQHHDEKPFEFEMNFSLFEMVTLIHQGYRPNRLDKDTHVKFSRFVNELILYRSETKELLIQEFNGESRRQFKLKFNKGFKTFQFIDDYGI
jgi:DNA phosphorothioation-dependent restriction protein DptF